MKWIAAAFLSVVFAVLSFNAFIANDLSRDRTGNRIIDMFMTAYGWLVSTIGATSTGIAFALCAIGIVLLAVMDGRGVSKSDA